MAEELAASGRVGGRGRLENTGVQELGRTNGDARDSGDVGDSAELGLGLPFISTFSSPSGMDGVTWSDFPLSSCSEAMMGSGDVFGTDIAAGSRSMSAVDPCNISVAYGKW